MPKFFLNLLEDGTRIDDPDGHELPALVSARAEAIRSAREIMAEDLRAGRPLHHGQIEICNNAGEVLEVVRFPDVLKALAD